jgi:alkanesulfonate monooxygenase SsuD/methylene tetrahydromethanopterin reductase-like flavin-dependent oxidoreductase (luciferase family)
MKAGMFQTPFLPVQRDPTQVFDWAVRQAVAAEEAGFADYWVGEHATLNWESIPNPELVVAAAARETTKIKLGPLAHLLPYHHPATLAVQTAWMSQILKGRYQLGVATGAYPSDAAVRGIKDMSVNAKMMREAIDIMQRIWKNEPFEFQGEFWKAGLPASDPAHPHPLRDMRPWGGKMPMAMTGLSSPSSSISYAAKNGMMPVSVYAGNDFLKDHFKTYAEISSANGRKTDRSMHSVVRDVFIADTDAEAKRLAINGGMGRAWKEYLTPTYHRFNVLSGLLHDKSVDQASVDSAYLAEHVWLVGSPQTVQNKIQRWVDELGGSFGTLLIYSYDYLDDPKPWEESMRRLATEVLPKIK